MSATLMLALLTLAGCPDPSGAPAAVQPDVTPTEAVPGQGGAGAGAPGPAGTVDARVNPGEGVVLSGTIAYEGAKKGRIRLDVLKVEENGPPMLSKTLELPAFGEWAIEMPKDFGSVSVVGFLDQTGDGPTADDPAVALPAPIPIGTTPVEGLALTLSDTPDLGALTPGAPPPDPAAANPPPQTGAAPIEGGTGSPGGPAGDVPAAAAGAGGAPGAAIEGKSP
jgi:hypothetical protein